MPLVINEIVSDVRVDRRDGDAKSDLRLRMPRNAELDRLALLEARLGRDRVRVSGVDGDDSGGLGR